MANSGVSNKFLITAEKLQQNQSGAITRYKVNAISPPTLNVFKGKPSYGITKWINPYPDIAFEKVVLPQWGGQTQDNAYYRTTTISNQPDYIKDYHFISLMRCIDFYNDSEFQAVINCQADDVKPSGT